MSGKMKILVIGIACSVSMLCCELNNNAENSTVRVETKTKEEKEESERAAEMGVPVGEVTNSEK